MIGEDYSHLQKGDTVTVCRFYYATPERRMLGTVVGTTKRYVKVEYLDDFSDIPLYARDNAKKEVKRFSKDGGHEPGERNPAPSYSLSLTRKPNVPAPADGGKEA
jgi:hypothetical protein